MAYFWSEFIRAISNAVILMHWKLSSFISMAYISNHCSGPSSRLSITAVVSHSPEVYARHLDYISTFWFNDSFRYKTKKLYCWSISAHLAYLRLNFTISMKYERLWWSEHMVVLCSVPRAECHLVWSQYIIASISVSKTSELNSAGAIFVYENADWWIFPSTNIWKELLQFENVKN